jgi:hypothetical protein
LKARVDLGDQTVEFIPFEVIRTAISTYFYLFLGINLRISISVINMRFQPDAPGDVIASMVKSLYYDTVGSAERIMLTCFTTQRRISPSLCIKVIITSTPNARLL